MVMPFSDPSQGKRSYVLIPEMSPLSPVYFCIYLYTYVLAIMFLLRGCTVDTIKMIDNLNYRVRPLHGHLNITRDVNILYANPVCETLFQSRDVRLEHAR